MTRTLDSKFKAIIARKTREKKDRLKAQKLAESLEDEKRNQLQGLVKRALAKAGKTLNRIFEKSSAIRKYLEYQCGWFYVFNANGIEKTEGDKLKNIGKAKNIAELGVKGKRCQLIPGESVRGCAVWTYPGAGSNLYLVHLSSGKLCVAIFEHKQPYGHVFRETDHFNTEMLSILAKFETVEGAMEMLAIELCAD